MVKPVVVVGAGLAGLVCARKLHQLGVPVIVVDADDRPGGRLKTDREGGFLLDRGFQTLFTAYPSAKRELDMDALNLGKFEKGAHIFHGGNLSLLEPQTLMDMFRTKFELVRSKTIPLGDKRLLAKFSGSAGHMSVRQAYATDPMPTEDYLRGFGFGDEIMDRFFRPFLGGIFLDKSLTVDSRQFLFVWAMLNQGQTAIPANGIQAIADQITADIPRYLFRFGNKVDQIVRDSHGHPTGIRFDTSETIDANSVVIATEAEEASRLAGQPTAEGHKSSTCLYFETATPVVDGAYLLLNGSGKGIVNHVAPVSNASPTYAPSGKHLASVTVLGNPEQSDQELAEIAKQELNEWVPSKGAYMWRFIRGYRIGFAQMAQPVGFIERLPGNATSHTGLYLAGEFTQNSSIDGAIRSGLEAAALVTSEQGAAEAA
ncbi:MAG: FAD-dependent oxidoreductase [Chlorobia bacterium]|nr:FAD-dependent oxidoreductase [Fimbriimonadaceae bacterium]